ncbi:Bifunctional polynucleotide phosphatase/kinase [Porphyridium purpureum]|uniref:Bifunctional polynucleotide phosphatase/kinase n=1 Tax=Porphyridium purpureum TaxID=35688 RepID=A0A5J4YV76_PORPP|nr:Bifunctional polynucleotide phosphatase/kinase [Porphyridium purpureum]|eukprot:POR2139..scf209_3
MVSGKMCKGVCLSFCGLGVPFHKTPSQTTVSVCATTISRQERLRNARLGGARMHPQKRKLTQAQLSFGPRAAQPDSESKPRTPPALKTRAPERGLSNLWQSVTGSKDGKAALLVFEKGLDAFLKRSCEAAADEKSPRTVRVSVAGFDLDDTLIRRRNGGKSYERQNPSDWVFIADNVKSKLVEQERSGSLVVVFTNQMQIRGAHDGKRASVFKAMVADVVSELGLGALVLLAATQKDSFRKGEGTGMWTYLESLMARRTAELGLVSISFKADVRSSSFVGDAAGRPRDHSDADASFAKACGLSFHTETDYFQLTDKNVAHDTRAAASSSGVARQQDIRAE